jgi:crossover junction endodeoxyribonuclease RuvC
MRDRRLYRAFTYDLFCYTLRAALRCAGASLCIARAGRAERRSVMRCAVRLYPYPSTVRVLGIDPGTAACGYGIVHESGGRVTSLASGCWTTSARERPELRLRVIFEGVQEVIATHAPDAVALEESYVGADARIALFVGQARGAAMVAAATAGVECTEYAPSRVKQSICGHGRADKGQMQRMVKMLLSLPEIPATSHEADALAVAICHALMPPLARMAS